PGSLRELLDDGPQVIVDMGLANLPRLIANELLDVVGKHFLGRGRRVIDQEWEDRDLSLDRGPNLAANPIVCPRDSLFSRFVVLDLVPVLSEHDDERNRPGDLGPDLFGELGARRNARDVEEDPLRPELPCQPRRDRVCGPTALLLATII